MFDRHGLFKSEAWDSWEGPSQKLCESALSKRNLTVAVLFLWASRMLGEIRDCVDLVMAIRKTPKLPQGANLGDTIHDHGFGDTDKHDIVALTECGRWWLYFIVILPNIMMSLCLLVFGAVLLISTRTFVHLILNILVLEFIIRIGQQIFKTFFPVSMKNAVKNHRFALNIPATHDATMICDYLKSFIYMVLIAVLVVLFFTRYQWIVPHYRHDIERHCGALQAGHEPKCHFAQADCFPYGKLAEEESPYRAEIVAKLGFPSKKERKEYEKRVEDDDDYVVHDTNVNETKPVKQIPGSYAPSKEDLTKYIPVPAAGIQATGVR